MPKMSMAPWTGLLARARDSMLQLTSHLRPLRSAVGSNNWVVSAAKSKTGVSMVANDPHLGLQYPPLFHLAVMTSANAADNLNLAGGSFPGIPGALVGRGAHVGWGVTVVGYDVTNLYLETLTLSGCATAALAPPIPCVVFNGNPVVLNIVPETYMVRVGPGPSGLVNSTSLGLGAAAPPPVVLIVPHHGPIIQLDEQAGTAVSVRWTGQEGNTQDLKAIYGLNTATDVDSAMASLALFSTGAQNFVLADDQGNIAYDPHALVPVRSFAGPTMPPWFPLPGRRHRRVGRWRLELRGDRGSRSRELLDRGCGAAARQGPGEGLLLHRERRSDEHRPVERASPTTTTRSHTRRTSASTGMTRADSARRASTRCSNDAITANGSVDLSDMMAIQSDHMSRPGKAFVDVIDALPASTDASVTMARAKLDAWAAAGYDCPSGLTGSDPNNEPGRSDAIGR